MRRLLPLAVLLLASSARAASLTEASEEAKAMTKLIKENPCYHNIELSVRSIQVKFTPLAPYAASPDGPPPAETRLYHDRACKMTGDPSAPRAERIYFDPEGRPWGLRLTTARGSELTEIEVVRRAGDEWLLNGKLGAYKTADLLARAVTGRTRLSMDVENMVRTLITMPHDIVVETIPYEHD